MSKPVGALPSHARKGVLQILPVLLLLIPLRAQAEQKWTLQYQYNRDQSTLHLVDFRCPSTQRCIAAGILEKNSKEQGVVVLTSNAGNDWSIVDVKDQPISLFFLDDTYGWMVTDKGIWVTEESGRSWKKIESPKKGILRVYFLDRSHGYAIGFPKTIVETKDGGKRWTNVTVAGEPNSIADNTVFEWLNFWGDHGVILGRELSRRGDTTPIWAERSPKSRREHKSLTLLIETSDGGKTWSSSTNEFLGHLTRLLLGKDSLALALLEYEDYYELPSTVLKMHLGTKGFETVFGEPDRAVTDLLWFPNGEAIIASVEPPGPSNLVPIPGKLKMFRGSNLRVWEEMNVDYRAVAERAMLAAPDPQHVWVATDTGMILNLVDSPRGSK